METQINFEAFSADDIQKMQNVLREVGTYLDHNPNCVGKDGRLVVDGIAGTVYAEIGEIGIESVWNNFGNIGYKGIMSFNIQDMSLAVDHQDLFCTFDSKDIYEFVKATNAKVEQTDAVEMDKFEQFKRALEGGRQTFDVYSANGDVMCCMAYESGDCNLIYGLTRRMRGNGELAQLSPFSHPDFIAVADKDGSNIVLNNADKFLENERSDETLDNYDISHVLDEMNKEITHTFVERFKDGLSIDDFDAKTQEEIAGAAARIARNLTIAGKTEAVSEGRWNTVVSRDDYLAIRMGEKQTAVVVKEYCEKHELLLMTDKETQRLLDKGGLLNETEERLAQALRLQDSTSTIKNLTITFEIDGKTAQAKMSPEKLRDALLLDEAFSSRNFDNPNAYLYVSNTLFADRNVLEERPITINDIKSITYNKQVLYTKDTDTETKPKKKEHAYEEGR